MPRRVQRRRRGCPIAGLPTRWLLTAGVSFAALEARRARAQTQQTRRREWQDVRLDGLCRAKVPVFDQKAADEGRIDVPRPAHIFGCFEAHLLQGVLARFFAIAGAYSLNPRDRTIHDSGQLFAEFGRAVVEQATLCFFRREPCGITIRLLRRF